ncbi:MAG: ATP-binding protein [Bdellovibrio sp.]|nr:ATP-binding protein [Bdellovibrio sp.]
MEDIKRILSLKKDLERKSVLLLGPRQTGKTTFLNTQIKFDKTFNLLHADIYTRLSQDPSFLRKSLLEKDKLILIDEIQKLPVLMDEVHALIEEKKVRFVLTGSSAKKLRTTHTGLTGGRLRVRHMFPFVSAELDTFNLNKILLYGTLPPIYTSTDPFRDLKDYVGTYLKEEIAAEALARNIASFSRYLKVAASCNTRQLNFETIGSESQVPSRTVREYFHLLEDTLIGTSLKPLKIKKGRKVTTKPKFYFFDAGIVNSLRQIKSISSSTELFGELFEQFLYNEFRAYLSYSEQLDEDTLSYWRTQRGEYEVDLVANKEIAFEFKSTQKVQSSDLKSLLALQDDLKLKKTYLISRDPFRRIENGIELLHYQDFLKELWQGAIL